MDRPTSIDTRATLEIVSAPLKMAGLAALSAAFVVGGWFMSQATVSTSRHSAETVVFWGWAAMIFFGLCLAITLWRLLTQRGPIITLSPAGIRDVRVTHDIVPWPAVANIATWQHSGQNVMVVGLHPGEEAKLRLTTIARMSRRANATLGADGLAITAQGTKISHDALMAAAIAYARAHGPPPTA
jgi:hypothetical protein